MRSPRPPSEKPLAWLKGQIAKPPFSREAARGAGFLLARLQLGRLLGLPHSRPMPAIGARCHELRVRDRDKNWRIIYRVDADAVLVLDVFEKKTRQTPQQVIDGCKKRLVAYDRVSAEARSRKAGEP